MQKAKSLTNLGWIGRAAGAAEQVRPGETLQDAFGGESQVKLKHFIFVLSVSLEMHNLHTWSIFYFPVLNYLNSNMYIGRTLENQLTNTGRKQQQLVLEDSRVEIIEGTASCFLPAAMLRLRVRIFSIAVAIIG